MREKICKMLNKVYGAVLMVSFFAGILPLIPFIIAIIIGGETGEAISLFLYKEYYPWVISAAAVSVIIGWIASYIKKSPSKKTNNTASDNSNNKK